MTAPGAVAPTTPRRRTSAGARGTLWGIVLAVVLVALGPELAGRALVVVGVVVVTLVLVANIAASLPASHRWTQALQGALRRTALFAGPAFFVVGTGLALQAGTRFGWLAGGLAAAVLGAAGSAGALRLQSSLEPPPRWATWPTGAFAAGVTVLVVLGIVLPKFRGVSGKAEDYPMRDAIDSLSRIEQRAHDSTGRYLTQREIARRGVPLATPVFTLAVESADSDGAYLTATSRTSPRKCGYVTGWVKDTLPEWHGNPPHLFPRCWTTGR